MNLFNTIGEEFKMAYDNATWNQNIGVIIRRLANGWYEDVYKGERRKLKGILILKQAGVWEFLPMSKATVNKGMA